MRVGEVVQRLGARRAGAQLEVDQPQLVGQILVRERQLLADALDRLVEAESGLDADDQQVERVGQRQPDPVLPALRHPAERHPGQQVSDRRGAERRGARSARPKTGSASERERHAAASPSRTPMKTASASGRR